MDNERTASEQALATLEGAIIEIGYIRTLNINEYTAALQGIMAAIRIVKAQIESEQTQTKRNAPADPSKDPLFYRRGTAKSRAKAMNRYYEALIQAKEANS